MRNRWVWLGLTTLVTIGFPLVSSGYGLALSDVWFTVVLGVSYLIPGAFVVVRAKGHLVGWLLVALGLIFSVAMVVESTDWSNQVVGLVVAVSWPSVFAGLAVLCLAFPEGRLVGDQDQTSSRVVLSILTLSLVLGLFSKASEGFAPNPLGLLPSWVGTLAIMLMVGGLLYSVVVLVARFRRSAGALRAQFAPVVAAFSVLVLSVLIPAAMSIAFPNAGDSIWAPALVSYLLLPTAFSISVVKYRLYAVGHVLRRTATYAISVGLLGAIYAAAVLSLDGTLTPLLGRGELSVALSTLLVFFAFRPIAFRVRRWVDRSFDRSDFDLIDELTRFRERSRDNLAFEGITSELALTVSRTLHPVSVSGWRIPNPWNEPIGSHE